MNISNVRFLPSESGFVKRTLWEANRRSSSISVFIPPPPAGRGSGGTPPLENSIFCKFHLCEEDIGGTINFTRSETPAELSEADPWPARGPGQSALQAWSAPELRPAKLTPGPRAPGQSALCT